MAPFSVADNAWIHVQVRTDAPPDQLADLLPGAAPGTVHMTGLRGVLLAAHLIEDLVEPYPPIESMIRRHLAALTARTTGLDTATGWTHTRQTVLTQGKFDPDTVNTYFDTWADRMFLQHPERPWLQDPRLEQECGDPAWAARIDPTRPSGNNAWWGNTIPVEQPIPVNQVPGWLLTWHGYAPAGLGSRRTHGGHTNGSAKAAPYRGFVSAFPSVGGDFFATLVVSIPSPQYWPSSDGGTDYAPWESPDLPNPVDPDPPYGVVSLLTARTTQAVMISPDAAGNARKVWVAWGSADDLPEATDPYLIPRSESGPVRAAHGSPAWREMLAFLKPEALRGKLTVYRPTALSSATDLPDDLCSRVGVRIVSWDQDRQDRNRAWWTEDLPGIMAYCQEADPEKASRAERALLAMTLEGSALGTALAGTWHVVYPERKSDERKHLLLPATQAYYREVEEHLWRVLEDDSYSAPWKKIAQDVFDRHVRSVAYHPHHLAAAARASTKMNAKTTAKKKKEKAGD